MGACRTVRISIRYPLKKTTQTFPPQQIASVDVVENKDVDGDASFKVRRTTVSGFSVVISEGSDMGHCEKLQAQFMTHLGWNGE
jgi:hypothetical protein